MPLLERLSSTTLNFSQPIVVLDHMHLGLNNVLVQLVILDNIVNLVNLDIVIALEVVLKNHVSLVTVINMLIFVILNQDVVFANIILQEITVMNVLKVSTEML